MKILEQYSGNVAWINSICVHFCGIDFYGIIHCALPIRYSINHEA